MPKGKPYSAEFKARLVLEALQGAKTVGEIGAEHERLNNEIKRRSNVIGVFPSAGSVVRLVGALLMEENDRWAAMSKAYYSTGVAELEGRMAELAGIAREQARLMSVG